MSRFAPGKILAAIVLALVTAPALLAENDDLPYLAYVVMGDTEVRSGPGESYYATDQLPMGAEVEVHRRDPGGWLAIRPPADSFCWIPAEKLELTNQSDVAEVTAADAVAWMGSNMQSVPRHRWQVRLEPGERVAILGVDARDDSGSGQARNWYKIAPPAGEFRWVHADDVRRVRAGRPANLATSHSPSRSTSRVVAAVQEMVQEPTLANPATNPHRRVNGQMKITTSNSPATPSSEPRGDSSNWVAAKKRPAEPVQQAAYVSEDPPADEQPAPRRRGPSMVLSNVSNVIPAAANEDVEPADSSSSARNQASIAARAAPEASPSRTDRPGETRVVWAAKSPRREVQQLDNPTPTSLAPLGASASRNDVDLERGDIELQLSLMVSRDPQLWNLAALRGRAEALIERAPTALERGQVRLLLEQIEDFEDLYERHVQAEKGVLVPTSGAAGSVAGRPTGSRVEPRFDGSGWLIPVHSVKRTAPPYAITDDGGKVVMYVTPAPGVNLHRYERKRVGIYGQRNSTQDLSVQVLTAHRVIDIERHTTR